MRRLICILAAVCLVCSGCAVGGPPEPKKYTATFLDAFDTVTSIVGYSDSEESFTQTANAIHEELMGYHKLFDIYNSYEGLNNLKTVNDNAGIAPVEVDGQIIELLEDCWDYYKFTGGVVNAAMGSVLRLWHEAREDGLNDPQNAYLPDQKALETAAEHMDLYLVQTDREAGTVYIPDPDMSLDVGAVAKGWAAQRVAQNAPEGLLISVGGNVCATGPKPGGNPWVVGIENPDGGEYLHKLNVDRGSVVTSGDYQRAYWVAGEAYHHIIDPDTLYPSTYWRAVTVLCEDSGLADALSTALFLLPRNQGQELLSACGAEAMWVDPEGTLLYSPGFEAWIRSNGT